jgi:phage/plasmid-like protein (TIGR03299 family)
MAANIEQFADGTSAFFSAREVAWHKLGTVTDGALNAADALKTAQLDSLVKVSEEPIYTKVDGEEIHLNKKFLTYRNHPKKGLTALGVVGSRYTPIQNLEAFEFLNHIADETGAVFETAGSLGNGERVFMTMKFPESMMIGGVDTINNYIMAVNSHDGSSAFVVAVTPIRAVCTNTVRLALAQAKSKVSLKHTSGATAKVQQARETLGVVFRYQEEFEKEVNEMLSIKITDKQYTEFIKTLVPEPKMKDPSDRMVNSVEKKRGELMALWKAPTQQNVAGTAWAAYNAVVEWSDWVKPIRSNKDEKDDLRSERMLFGGAEKFKAKAQLLLTK